MHFTLHAIGDSAVKVDFADGVSPELNREIQLFCSKIGCAAIPGIVEWVPAFDSVTIYYRPQCLNYTEVCDKIYQINRMNIDRIECKSRLISIPIVYGGKYGPDLGRVAESNNLSENEIIRIHCEQEYLVYMLGFLPGFPYLGGLDKRIATPRLDEPRAKTVAGSVGIAHEQTGIYPIDSPGGWNIIGKTPLTLFDREKEDAFLFRAGDRVKFYEVSDSEIDKQVESGEFVVEEADDGSTD
ncbi:inhibitor of KinA [Virgibacillus subterraneus]|uniref:Inhibitor of KinA n=1 Tax=Virgibacillus subterraneus TaxID=621109 RepID=A0A1H9BKM2_9BACI|nr:5-oxoprolinase subunit PxpB [Virgibacillus subterraneus]SEP89540.1 inhibitor of KinA [Virgibacillus subterraneus]